MEIGDLSASVMFKLPHLKKGWKEERKGREQREEQKGRKRKIRKRKMWKKVIQWESHLYSLELAST